MNTITAMFIAGGMLGTRPKRVKTSAIAAVANASKKQRSGCSVLGVDADHGLQATAQSGLHRV